MNKPEKSTKRTSHGFNLKYFFSQSFLFNNNIFSRIGRAILINFLYLSSISENKKKRVSLLRI